jgi:2-keto-3-deoxy-L-rhamnonate aldolase RhmA
VNTLNQRRLKLKKKFKERKKIFAAWTSLGHPSITEIFLKSPFDFVGIDMEHSTISQQEAQRIIAASHAGGSLCLPRIASHNSEMAKRLLDSGADGLIVPMVNSPKEVKEIIKWVKYSPRGKRSFGIARAQGYGFDFEEYVKDWNKTSIIIAQIESREAVENIEEILSFKEIDGVMIGPYDISSSLNIPGKLEHKRVKALCNQVIKACRRHKKSCGTQNIEPDLKSIKKDFSEGYTFVVLASDVFLLWKWTSAMGSYINRVK